MHNAEVAMLHCTLCTTSAVGAPVAGPLALLQGTSAYAQSNVLCMLYTADSAAILHCATFWGSIQAVRAVGHAPESASSCGICYFNQEYSTSVKLPNH